MVTTVTPECLRCDASQPRGAVPNTRQIQTECEQREFEITKYLVNDFPIGY